MSKTLSNTDSVKPSESEVIKQITTTKSYDYEKDYDLHNGCNDGLDICQRTAGQAEEGKGG